MNTTYAAIDLGASSGRVITGHLAASQLQITEVHRFSNGVTQQADGLHWDVTGLYSEAIIGLRRAGMASGFTSIGIDSWAVDYALMGPQYNILNQPFHYRDSRTSVGLARLDNLISPEELFSINGLQRQPFNTISQLLAHPPEQLQAAERLQMIPDLFAFWLTGQTSAELTNASTTGLLDTRSRSWSLSAMDRCGIPVHLFEQICEPGQVLGGLTPQAAARTQLSTMVEVVTVASHDTASAIAAVPAQSPDFAYISCGTWGLVGVETTLPILSEAARRANFTNEIGADGSYRFLRNVMGLWLVQECLSFWQKNGSEAGLRSLLDEAKILPRRTILDPDSPHLFTPGNMPERISQECTRTGQPTPRTAAEYIRCIMDSLALAYSNTVRQAEALSGITVNAVYIVGGGVRNELLCQLISNETQLPVIAGPVEATAIGNILLQASTRDALACSTEDRRRLVRSNINLLNYWPQGTSFLSKHRTPPPTSAVR